MREVVKWWMENENPLRPGWDCFLASDPRINYTDRPFETMRANFVANYNQRRETELTVDDFEWVEIRQEDDPRNAQEDIVVVDAGGFDAPRG